MQSGAFGHALCSELAVSERREWLVSNGLGGFACGTIAGVLTRRYHGILIATLEPPLGRRLLVAKFDETVRYDRRDYALGTNRYRDGTIDPHGYTAIERFEVDGTTPVWTFALGDALLEKRVWMEYGENTTYVRYTLLRGRDAIDVRVRAFTDDRDYHGSTHAAGQTPLVAAVANGVRIDAFEQATPVFVTSAGAYFEADGIWYRDFLLARERDRGLDETEDHFSPGSFSLHLMPGQSATVIASVHGDADSSDALERARARDATLREAYARAHPASKPPMWIDRLVLAADRFVAERTTQGVIGRTIIAGYPWFGDWGRDTMIALPGLLLATGRAEVAREILVTFAQFIDGGMLPNALPEPGSPLAYNTVDAALWYIEAVAAYRDASGDTAFVATIFAQLESIVDATLRGTRYGIRAQPDGLVFAGTDDTQLTWMDARVNGIAVTPRIGKPIEICALWYNALRRLAELAPDAGRDPARFATLADRTRASFQRFWNDARAYAFDVLDGPSGNDAAIRPNAIFAVSLKHSPLEPPQQHAIVATCLSLLYARTGLRSLAPDDPQYRAAYGGPPAQRDGAYHQGTAWTWLLGPLAIALLRAYGDADAARALLEPFGDALDANAVGFLGELTQPEAPFAPDGAFAQAWSVGEVLRAWHEIGPGATATGGTE
jgi:predicted glycogen debranching enzyme